MKVLKEIEGEDKIFLIIAEAFFNSLVPVKLVTPCMVLQRREGMKKNFLHIDLVGVSDITP